MKTGILTGKPPLSKCSDAKGWPPEMCEFLKSVLEAYGHNEKSDYRIEFLFQYTLYAIFFERLNGSDIIKIASTKKILD